MINELTKLYNTLMLVETKGESTKILANCLIYVEQLVSKEKESEKVENKMQAEEVK